MSKYVLKPLTELTWILMSDGNRLGLVSQTSNGINIIGNIEPKQYKDIAELQKKFDNKLLIEKPIEVEHEPETVEVNGFPIKHKEFYNVLTETVSSYTRTETSSTRYAAGYYGLRFPNGWTSSFCPKLTTLSEYEYIGPFTTRLEMQHQISSKNKEIMF